MFRNFNTCWSEHPSDNMEFKPYDRVNFKPRVANWYNDLEPIEEEDDDENLRCQCNLYDYEHNENLHYEEDTSFFPDINGNIVHYGQDVINLEPEFIETICCNCETIQDNNILLQICANKHYLCSECYDKEKGQSFRQNAEYERQQRINHKQKIVEPYIYTCPICKIGHKLKFNLNIREYYHDVEIIPVYKI